MTTTEEETGLGYQDILNYECATEAINHLSSIYMAEILKEEGKENPDKSLLAIMNAEFSRLSDEQRNLRIDDHEEIARIRSQYGKMIRERRISRKAA